jgi:hypothetical protein
VTKHYFVASSYWAENSHPPDRSVEKLLRKSLPQIPCFRRKTDTLLSGGDDHTVSHAGVGCEYCTWSVQGCCCCCCYSRNSHTVPSSLLVLSAARCLPMATPTTTQTCHTSVHDGYSLITLACIHPQYQHYPTSYITSARPDHMLNIKKNYALAKTPVT